VSCDTGDRNRVCGEGAHAHPGFDPGRIGSGGGQGIVGAMIPVPSGVRVWLAVGHTDMRRGMNSLALQVQEVLKRDPHAGDLYVFRGKRGHLIKILWHDGIGMSLYAKRLERGRFLWPSPADGIVAISAAQLAYMLDGIDWRNPVRTWRPAAAG
jgi:transposase